MDYTKNKKKWLGKAQETVKRHINWPEKGQFGHFDAIKIDFKLNFLIIGDYFLLLHFDSTFHIDLITSNLFAHRFIPFDSILHLNSFTSKHWKGKFQFQDRYSYYYTVILHLYTLIRTYTVPIDFAISRRISVRSQTFWSELDKFTYKIHLCVTH